MALWSIVRALIPAAGRGLRRLPATKAQPKEMLPVVDRPAIEYVVAEAAASGCDEVILVVGSTKQAIRDHFSPPRPGEYPDVPPGLQRTLDLIGSVRIRYLLQREPRGLGHAVYQARRLLSKEPFAVLLGDDILVAPRPCTRDLRRAQERNGGSVVAVGRQDPSELHRYGVVDLVHRRGRLWPVRGLVEKPATGSAPSPYAILGRYILQPKIFRILARTPPGRGGEIQLTDAIHRLAQRDLVYACPFRGRRLDTGGTVDWILANLELGLRDPRYQTQLRLELRKRRL